MFKKRIGNDITITWHIYRKSGETQTPESFDGKDVEVKLISPLQRPVTIEDVTIATGVVTFTFRGKHQVTLGNYVAVLQENKGEDGMVTLDVVNAVTLVPHSYMEEDGDEGDVIEAASVELESSISAGGGGVSVDAYTKAESNERFVHYSVNTNKGISFLGNNEVSVLYYSYIQPNGVTVSASSNTDGTSHVRGIDVTADNIELRSTRRVDPDEPVTRQTTVVWHDELDEALAGKQDVIQDLDTIRSGAQAGATAYRKPITGIPATDLASDVQNGLAAIDGIEAVIPEQASSSNQLADKNFVNSSIATATATYRGSYNLVTDLHLSVSATHAQIATALATAIQIADNNDYCYVQIPVADATPTEITSVERYKFNGTAWEYEYTLNNSGYTAAQWAALNSGITSGLVAKLSALPTNSELTTLLSEKANTADLAPVATSGNYNDLTDKPTVDDTPTPGSDNLVKSGGVYSTTPSIKNTDAESDLDFSDEDGNVLMRLSGGHIKTKNFDSQKRNVKISYLSIGNSVNQDVAAYLPYLLKSIYGNDIDFEIGIAFIGSYTIKDYVEQVITNNKKIEKFSYANNTDVLTNYDDAFYLEDLLSLKKWNIISFQMYQANTSGTGRTEDVTLAPQLLQYLKRHCISSCKFGLITPATYTDVRNLYMQWQQTILTSCSLDFIFDYGATKEFLINKGISSSMLCTDGYHSNDGYPCITIALTAIHGIASIFNLENKASNFKDRMTYAKYQTLNIPNPNGDFQTATEEQWYIGVNSAIDGNRVSKSTYNISNDSLRLQTFNN